VNQLRARLAGWLVLQVCLALAAVAGAMALVEILADAALDLSDSARLVAPGSSP